MIRRRLSVALVAAVGTSLALVTPAQAETPGASGEIFLAQSSGSSTSVEAEELDDQVDGEGDGDEDETDLPEWAQSAVLDDEGVMIFEFIGALLKLGLTVTQGVTVLAPLVPGGEDMVRDFLRSVGIQP